MMTQNFLAGTTNNPNTPVPSKSVENTPPSREPIKHMLIGSPKAVTSTIHHLQVLGYASVSDWSPLARTANPGEVMSILSRSILVQ